MSPTGEEGANRSGEHCTVMRAATDLEDAVREEGADKSAGRCMVPLKPQLQPKLSPEQRRRRLELAKPCQEDHAIKLSSRRAGKTCECGDTKEGFCSPFSRRELQHALSKLKPGKSPGPDMVSNDMLRQLSPTGETELLRVLNRSWTEGTVPASWRAAEIVAIPKKGKSPALPSSYRPISLLNTISKLAERLVQNRLQHWLERHKKLNPNQAGFRKGHSTIDQLFRVTQSIFDAFEQPKHHRAILVLLDFAKAYDRVWRDGLFHKMEKMGIPGCATRWVKALLTDRRARVRWGNARSSQRVFQEGLPQGSVMAPLLWLIYCNDLDEDINTNTTRSLYADDTALLATGPSLQACADQLQPDLDQVARWLDKWKVEASPSKCVFTTFSLHAKEVNGKVVPTLTFKGDQLAHEKNPTFLGLTLDSQLTFTNHIEEVKKRMAQRRCCLTALAGRSYGCDQATLRAAYIAYIRSVADYGAALYSTHAAPSVRARLEAEQHKCARVITGCIRLTNSETLITEAGLPPLAVRGWEIAAMEQERLARLPPGDPARALTERHVRPRLKHRAHEAWQRAHTEARRRGEPPPDPPSEDTALPFKPCFRRVSQWMAKEAGLADLPREPLALVPEQPPWTNPADAVTFRLSLPRVTRRDDPPAVRKAAALEAIAMVNPDCTIWSDGSAKSGTRDGGGGALIQLHRENREVETLVPAGSVCSSMRAELAAMLAAFTCLLAQPGETRSRIKTCLLCTDSLSGLQLLQRGPEAQKLVLAERVWAAMGSLGEQNTAIILQWVPGHADIAGNEAADRLANRAAAECAQSETPIDLASARTAIRQRAREMQATRAHRHPHPQPTPGLQDLPRWGQVTVSQLRTGYCPLARATLHRLELTPDPLCRECGAEDTVRHLLTECPAFATTRRRLWGDPCHPSTRSSPGRPTVTASYYQDNILETALKSALSRTRENGPPTKVKLHPDMSKVIFQQDGAPAHTAGTSQPWCEEHLPDFWRKENKMDEIPAATSRDGLVDSLKLAWRKIPRETLDNLISGMPERMQACVKERGGYIGK
ncbi:uncharacterized protein LOC122386167 [Amphibalanus amphitrite]|uniref:uncharacterized protein LOC122386167 n=1 Tax=Amphibalanus amphitrite TaxID=1232801 RepID=UPI001C8FF784|nr:uncharacterized protein LOC122386167 [Amphibalanus amphitrite]